MPRAKVALIVLNLSAILVVVGGSYDLLVPALPPHQLAFLGVAEDQLEPHTAQLLRAMFRALGGCLIAVGIGALFLINRGLRRGHNWATVAVLTMVGVAEGLNSVQMYRVGSPFWAPLIFIGLLAIGVALAYVPSPAFKKQPSV
jgi:hypothetical protein